MQRTGEPGLREFDIERIRSRQGVGVDHDDGVERRTLAVMGVDGGEIHLDQLSACQFLRLEGSEDVRNRGLLGPDQPDRTGLGRHHGEQEQEQRGSGETNDLFVHFLPPLLCETARWRAIVSHGPHPEEAAHRSRACPTSATLKCRNRQQPISMRGRPDALEGRRMAAGTISLAAVLRDARKSALLRTRLMDQIDMIRTMETLYEPSTNS